MGHARRGAAEATFGRQLEDYRAMIEIGASFGLGVNDYSAWGSGYRLETPAGTKRLAEFPGADPEAFLFFARAFDEMRASGLDTLPRLHRLPDGRQPAFARRSGRLYYLADWPDARPINLDNVIELEAATRLLAAIHSASRHVTPPSDERLTAAISRWGAWPASLTRALESLCAARDAADGSPHKDRREKDLMQHADDALRVGAEALDALRKGGYSRAVSYSRDLGTIVHGGFRATSLFYSRDGRVWLLDLGAPAYAERISDLGPFVREIVSQGRWRWDAEQAVFVIQRYNEASPLMAEEAQAVAAYVSFPHDLCEAAGEPAAPADAGVEHDSRGDREHDRRGDRQRAWSGRSHRRRDAIREAARGLRRSVEASRELRARLADYRFTQTGQTWAAGLAAGPAHADAAMPSDFSRDDTAVPSGPAHPDRTPAVRAVAAPAPATTAATAAPAAPTAAAAPTATAAPAIREGAPAPRREAAPSAIVWRAFPQGLGRGPAGGGSAGRV